MQHHLFLLLSLFETPQDTTLLLSGSKTGRTYGGVCSDRFNARITGASKVKTTYGNKFMSNEQNQSDAKAHPVDTLVMRDAEISKKILIDRRTIKDVANEHGIGQVRARQIMHNYCRKSDAETYNRLKHSNTYVGGWTNDDCLPYLVCLRLNADKFCTV